MSILPSYGTTNARTKFWQGTCDWSFWVDAKILSILQDWNSQCRYCPELFGKSKALSYGYAHWSNRLGSDCSLYFQRVLLLWHLGSNLALNFLQSCPIVVYSWLTQGSNLVWEWKHTLCHITITAQQDIDRPQTFLLFTDQDLQEFGLQPAHTFEQIVMMNFKVVLMRTGKAQVNIVVHKIKIKNN